MQRAMATEAEASREARAKVIAAEGDQKASIALKEAADMINQSPVALQLRYLQTLGTIAAEKNSTIIFPIPMEMLRHFSGQVKSQSLSFLGFSKKSKPDVTILYFDPRKKFLIIFISRKRPFYFNFF